MTENKPIIIDEVDVSKCDNYLSDYQIANNIEGCYEHIKDVCECGDRSVETFNFYCKDNPNCYFKQLIRKTQECERLKELKNIQ